MRTLPLLTLTVALAIASPAVAAPFSGSVLIGCNEATVAPIPPPDDQFKVDPIVSFGQPQSGHRHVFFGSDQASSSTTYGQMVAGGTSCDIHSDRTLYWVPNIIRADGTPVPPGEVSISVYYRGGGLPSVPFPAGLRFVWGDHSNLYASRSVARWGCGNVPNLTTIPATCATRIGMFIYVGQCWDGKNLGAGGGGADNVTGTQPLTSRTGPGDTCPADHPVHLPELQYQVSYPSSAAGGRLSSDEPGAQPGASAHVDFFNGWTFNSQGKDAISLLTNECLNVDGIPGTLTCRDDGTQIVRADGSYLTD